MSSHSRANQTERVEASDSELDSGPSPSPLLLTACRLLYYCAGGAVLGLVVFLTASGVLGGEPARQVARWEPSQPLNLNVSSVRPNYSPLPTFVLIGDWRQVGTAAELSAWYGPTEVVVIQDGPEEDAFLRRLDRLNAFLRGGGNPEAQVVDLRAAAWFSSGR